MTGRRRARHGGYSRTVAKATTASADTHPATYADSLTTPRCDVTRSTAASTDQGWAARNSASRPRVSSEPTSMAPIILDRHVVDASPGHPRPRSCYGPIVDELQYRFFSTVFLGSGLLFLASLFTATAVAGGLVESYATDAAGSDVWTFGRASTYAALNVYAVKMAGVFMISIATISWRTRRARALARGARRSARHRATRSSRHRRAGAAPVPRLGVAGQHVPPGRHPRRAGDGWVVTRRPLGGP